MNNIHFIKYAAAVAAGALILAASPAVALTLSVSGVRTLSGQETRLQLIEWQGGKATNSNSDWDKGGGYGGKKEKQEDSNSKDDSEGSGWKSGKSHKDCKETGTCKGDTSSNSEKKEKHEKNEKKESGTSSGPSGDSCSDKFVPGSKAWKDCKGISSNDTAKKPENAFLTPAQCAAKFKKGTREYLACIM